MDYHEFQLSKNGTYIKFGINNLLGNNMNFLQFIKTLTGCNVELVKRVLAKI